MNCVHVITPVKDSIDLTLETAEAVLSSDIDIPLQYTVYNDFSTEENTAILQRASKRLGFELLNMSEITYKPSPNYMLILQLAQFRALRDGAGLLIVESDVVVRRDTLRRLVEGASLYPDCGLAAAVTVDEKGFINYPYLYARGQENSVFPSKKHLSFCCTLLTPRFLEAYDFLFLDPEKNWFDVTISHAALDKGFRNYLFTNLPVWHRPHSSRPQKQKKYKNPWAYYWEKFTKGRDKI
ncbi:MAG: glycosyltransferase family 2 protein [Prevotellaceae bacterium]|nr:glycosyltransferase family 2 protein [Prevotellaceae bacterium]